MTSSVKNAARSSRSSTPARALARGGFAVNGLVNAVIGIINVHGLRDRAHKPDANQCEKVENTASRDGEDLSQ